MKISVVTVAYNAADTILNTLKSVAAQNHHDIEHIVIDGASSDGTAELVRANLEKVDVFVSEPDRGIYDAMNKGVGLATGEVIGFLNADDVYAHDGVLSQIERIHQDQQLDACYADLIYFKKLSDARPIRYWRSKPFRAGLCFTGWMPAHPTLYVKARVFEQVGDFNTSLGNQADLEFCARAFELSNIKSHYQSEIWVHMLAGGASQRDLLTMIKSNWASYKALRKLGMKRTPMGFFTRKFAAKIPQLFTRPRS